MLSFSHKEGFLNPKWSLFVHNCLKEYNFITYFLLHLHGYMIGLATATATAHYFVYKYHSKPYLFFSDIQFCARSNFSKNSNECMSFLSTAECQLLTKKKGQTTILPGPITVPVSVWKTGYSSPSLSASIDTLG